MIWGGIGALFLIYVMASAAVQSANRPGANGPAYAVGAKPVRDPSFLRTNMCWMVSENAQKPAAQKLGINVTHNLADPDPSLGPPYSHRVAGEISPNWSPKSVLTA